MLRSENRLQANLTAPHWEAMEIDMSDYDAFDVRGFSQWLNKVDNELVSMCGLGYMDLADQNYSDAFEDGLKPEEMARDVLISEGYYDYINQ